MKSNTKVMLVLADVRTRKGLLGGESPPNNDYIYQPLSARYFPICGHNG